MRAKRLVMVGGLVLVLIPAVALFGQPGSSSKGKSKGSGTKGGGPGFARPSDSSGGGGPGAPGSPGSGNRPVPGAPGGGPGQGGPGGGTRDPNQFFDFLAKGKEVIVRDELDPRMQGMFDRMADQLGVTNGQISRQQFQQVQASRTGGGPSGSTGSSGFPSSRSGPGGGFEGRRGPGGGGDYSPESAFRRYDLNGDGVLNYDEMPDVLQAERSIWDRDENGFIDITEYSQFHMARLEQMWRENGSIPGGLPFPNEQDSKPVVYRAGKLPPGLPPWFAQLDTDTDAQVGVYEWKTSGRPFDEFNGYDRNGDGFVTVQEMLRLTATSNGLPGTGDQRGGQGNQMASARPSPGSPGAGPPSGPGGRPAPGGPGAGPAGPGGGRTGPGSSGGRTGPGQSGYTGKPSAGPGSGGYTGKPPAGPASGGTPGKPSPGQGSNSPTGRTPGTGGR